MNVAFSPVSVEGSGESHTSGLIRIVCPVCRNPLAENVLRAMKRCRCGTCGFLTGQAAGFPDLRIASDRYLSRNQETRKARKLADRESVESLENLVRYYYRITADVSRSREERFVRHILDAKSRGHALLARLPCHGSILELGCGTGGFVAAAAEAGRRVVGVDIASRWLVVARKRLASLSAPAAHRIDPGPTIQGAAWPSLIAACAQRLPFPDGSFPIVVADGLLEHVADPRQVMAEMIRVLRPGGTLVIWFPNGRWIGPDPHVGLIGLPLLPRELASRYVAIRRGPIFWPRCGTGQQWRQLARGIDAALEIQTLCADPGGWPFQDRSFRARAARTMGALSRIPVASGLLARYGPLGELFVRKPEVSAFENRADPIPPGALP